MEIILALTLFLGIAILIALIFIGYHLYANNKKSALVNDMLSKKESELLDLYNILEQMMNEIDDFTREAKSEITRDKEQINRWYHELQEKAATKKTTTRSTAKKTETPPKAAPKSKPKNEDKSNDLKEKKIKSMYNKGTTIPNIAREMNIGQGEVQLILNLDKKMF